jgi:hypothetical protein
MGTAYRSRKLSNSGSPRPQYSFARAAREHRFLDFYAAGHQLAHRIQTLL